MGIFNKVVNILVLVFALAGVALSFLLFNKREMLVAGWEEMSSAVVQTAKSLEKDSGTKLSAKVNKDALGHKNPDTDSICSALAYAYLKNTTEGGGYIAARAGSTNSATPLRTV